jgi:hypothetical protein
VALQCTEGSNNVSNVHDAASRNLTENRVVHPGFVRTPLTANARRNPVYESTAIAPEEVADGVVNQILSGYGAQLIIPAAASGASLLRGLPTWMQIRQHDALSTVMVDLINRAKTGSS